MKRFAEKIIDFFAGKKTYLVTLTWLGKEIGIPFLYVLAGDLSMTDFISKLDWTQIFQALSVLFLRTGISKA